MSTHYWMTERSGALLRSAVEAYLTDAQMTAAQVTAMREYLRQWIAAPWRGQTIEQLRSSVDALTSQEAIDHWLEAALAEGIDPL